MTLPALARTCPHLPALARTCPHLPAAAAQARGDRQNGGGSSPHRGAAATHQHV